MSPNVALFRHRPLLQKGNIWNSAFILSNWLQLLHIFQSVLVFAQDNNTITVLSWVYFTHFETILKFLLPKVHVQHVFKNEVCVICCSLFCVWVSLCRRKNMIFFKSALFSIFESLLARSYELYVRITYSPYEQWTYEPYDKWTIFHFFRVKTKCVISFLLHLIHILFWELIRGYILNPSQYFSVICLYCRHNCHTGYNPFTVGWSLETRPFATR